MATTPSLVVLAAFLQVISCQGQGPPLPSNLPPQCRGPPQGVDKPHDCCKIPPFFTEKDFEECGFKKLDDDNRDKRGPPDCSKQLCMLKKYKLAKDDETIDHEAVGKFVEEWAKAHPEFEAASLKARERCVGQPLPGPPQICEANKVLFCVTSTVFKNCPKWEQTEGCTKLKAHIDECAQYFPEH